MTFWDASALVPLCLTEPRSDGMKRLAQQDPDLIVWWTSLVECWSAFTRARREGKIDARREHLARGALESLRRGWTRYSRSRRFVEWLTGCFASTPSAPPMRCNWRPRHCGQG